MHGGTKLYDDGLVIVLFGPKPPGQMIKTFFHEMTHVKQHLVGELIDKPRHRMWKGEKWDNKLYSDAPWEVEARTFSDVAYYKFLRCEVNRSHVR